MKPAVIVAEYDPFHNGHLVHIQQTRRQGATHVAVILGGDFLQRGEAALCEKHHRAKMALLAGADLVVELPLAYSCATAERFAYGAVSLAGALGCAHYISFGSECGDVPHLAALAQLLEGDAFSRQVKEELAAGVTFAAARQLAVARLAGEGEAALLASPNNILGIEYLRQVYRQGLSLTPMTLCRAGAAHNAAGAVQGIASASHIRACWERGEQEGVKALVPPTTWQCLAGVPRLDREKLAVAQLAYLRRLDPEQLAALPDVSEGIENRLYDAIRQGRTLGEVLELAKTKRYPMARLRRLCLSAYLGIRREDAQLPPPYLRVLACGPGGTQLLRAARRAQALPVSDSLAKLRELGGRAERFARQEALAADLYTAALEEPLPCGSDYTTPAFYPMRTLADAPGK